MTRLASGATSSQPWRAHLAGRDGTGGAAARPACDDVVRGPIVTRLVNGLVANSGQHEAVLVLDDYHVIDSAAVHSSLGFLVEHRPPGLRLVLAGRSDPPLVLARLRARGELAELRAADLRFTAGEAAELLDQMEARPRPAAARSGCGCPGGSHGGVGGRAPSWPACPSGARLIWPGSWPPSPAATATSWTTWPRRCSSTRASSYGSSWWTPRCWNASAGRCATPSPAAADSQALLEQIEGAGLFLIPLDEVRGWWRYHHLFADLLRARLV